MANPGAKGRQREQRSVDRINNGERASDPRVLSSRKTRCGSHGDLPWPTLGWTSQSGPSLISTLGGPSLEGHGLDSVACVASHWS